MEMQLWKPTTLSSECHFHECNGKHFVKRKCSRNSELPKQLYIYDELLWKSHTFFGDRSPHISFASPQTKKKPHTKLLHVEADERRTNTLIKLKIIFFSILWLVLRISAWTEVEVWIIKSCDSINHVVLVCIWRFTFLQECSYHWPSRDREM